jgi:hypothetical protein
MLIRFNAPLWEWQGKGAWHFLTLPVAESGMIRMAAPRKAGFGSVRVKATIGATSWNTSIFPDKKSGTYLLPVKADVRKAEDFSVGDAVEVTLSLDL